MQVIHTYLQGGYIFVQVVLTYLQCKPRCLSPAESQLHVDLLNCLHVAQCRASSHRPLVLYLPSIEAWALDTVTISNEEVEEGEAAGAEQNGSGPTPTRNAQPSITPLKSYPASISPFR